MKELLKRNNFRKIENNVFRKGNLEIYLDEDNYMEITYSDLSEPRFKLFYQTAIPFKWKLDDCVRCLKKADMEAFEKNFEGAFDNNEKTSFLIWGLGNGMTLSVVKGERMAEGRIRKWLPYMAFSLNLFFSPSGFSHMTFRCDFGNGLYAEGDCSEILASSSIPEVLKDLKRLFCRKFSSGAEKFVKELEALK